jgi:predicted GNAT family acetyltransferase
MNQTVHHDEARKRFICMVDGHECSVDYEINQEFPKVLDLQRTFVHPEARGKGIAEYLLKSVTDFAGEKGYSIRPTCSYAVSYYRRHPENAGVLVKGTDLENGGGCRLEKPSQ